MASFLGGIADAVGEKASSAAETVSSTSVGEAASALANQAKAFAEEKKTMIEEFEREKKRLIAGKIKSALDAVFDFALDEFAVHIKEAFEDPYRPEWAKTMINDIIDSLWPDVKDEFKDVILSGIAGSQGITHGDPSSCSCCCCGGGPIAWVRYTLYPYDRNFWRLIRNPFWWFWKLLFIFPKYGVSQASYALWFLLLDKRDEFQLQEFIVMFKSLQFLSLGILSSFVGSVQYFICTSQNNCHEWAPQENIWTVIMFVAQVIVCWLAFALLSCSYKKGGQYYQLKKKREYDRKTNPAAHMEALSSIAIGDQIAHSEHEEANAAAKARSRGRLMKFLIYDLIIFIICVGLGVWMAYANFIDEDDAQLNNGEGFSGVDENGSNWKFKAGLFWIKAFYGLMSFPFVLLLLPGISTLLSHSRPTGYNRWGNVVPYLGHEEEQPTPWRDYHIDKRTGERVDPLMHQFQKMQEEQRKNNEPGFFSRMGDKAKSAVNNEPTKCLEPLQEQPSVMAVRKDKRENA